MTLVVAITATITAAISSAISTTVSAAIAAADSMKWRERRSVSVTSLVWHAGNEGLTKADADRQARGREWAPGRGHGVAWDAR